MNLLGKVKSPYVFGIHKSCKVFEKMLVESIGKIYGFSCTFHGYHLVAIGK